ncbi:hypothetical protein ACEYW6_33315 [Nostoc sp. UIC 10607]|uniref:hypothetical protein n=1 Tax=Nostoc sp. UIC 10607 TaxID=3045935 RepID=UPI0039A0B334
MSKPELIQPLFLPRGVAEPSGKIGYVANVTSGIDAIDLSNGRTLWTTSEASYPLLATTNWLAAQKMLPEQSNAFAIAKLDTERKGSLLLLSEPIVFPDWVSVQPPNDEDFSFKVHASKDDLFLDWQAHSRYRGGANPPAYILQQSTREDRGTVRVDLKSGKVEMLPSTERTTVQPKEASIDEQFGSAWWIAGQNLAVLVWEESQGQQVLQLRKRGRSANHRGEKVVELARGKALVSYVTPDGCYILVYPDVPKQLRSGQKQLWWIFPAETGHLLAKLNYEVGTQAASIFNSKIYYLVNKEVDSTAQGVTLLRSVLKAKDLSSDKLLWEHLLQEQPTRNPPPLPQ